MDIYFAGSRTKDSDIWMWEHGYNRLLSYVNDRSTIPYWVEMKRQNPSQCKLFIDSGAFTMWTKGQTVNVDEYIDWLNERVNVIDLFGQVDVIPGEINKVPSAQQVDEAAEKTWENYLYMRGRVLNKDGLLYTFHVGEDIKYLKAALEFKTENGASLKYLALGGMVRRSTPVKKSFLNMCYNAIWNSSNPNIKVHTFGMTSLPLLSQYPITSADSTGWLMTAVNGYVYSDFGTIRVSNQNDVDVQEIEEDDFDVFKQKTSQKGDTGLSYNNLTEEEKLLFKQYVESQGFTLQDLQESHAARGEFNIQYFAKCANDLVQKPASKKLLQLF